jgi:hypothetical protein
MASPTIHVATPTSFQAVFPYVARIAPTTTGTQATRASLFTLSDTLRVRDVSEDRVNLPLLQSRRPKQESTAPDAAPPSPPSTPKASEISSLNSVEPIGNTTSANPAPACTPSTAPPSPPPMVLKRHLNRRGFTLRGLNVGEGLLSEP